MVIYPRTKRRKGFGGQRRKKTSLRRNAGVSRGVHEPYRRMLRASATQQTCAEGIAQRENGCGVTPDPWSSSSLTANWTVRPHHLERDSTRLTCGHGPK
ncbi:hypothetical protein NPIL_194671 [Nephila pilipes]|uniref:Uncharacterized protein n=1 Tax=Nephila pilipes TaxID=299642 RepID=A0A8X6PJ14_NEPPI|nr:hypothetical protein NPIL_194671 [Nephila pilipes]